jgi:hypothetical protein
MSPRRRSSSTPQSSSSDGLDSRHTPDRWFTQRCQYRRDCGKQIFKSVAAGDDHDDKETGICRILLEL